MERQESVEQQVEARKKAVKMSSMFNNELLHALSIYCLANNLNASSRIIYCL